MSKLRRTAPPIGWEHVRNCFPMPNELFLFNLSANALAVYIYLLYCADRHTGQCHPSMPTMAKKLHLSRSTVLRCVKTLEETGLIATEHTDIVTKQGIKRNGNLRYTILPSSFPLTNSTSGSWTLRNGCRSGGERQGAWNDWRRKAARNVDAVCGYHD